MNVDSNRFRGSSKPRLDQAREELSRCLDKELSLLVEERRDRAVRLGIDRALPKHRPSRTG
jgi:hypothetical protein